MSEHHIETPGTLSQTSLERNEEAVHQMGKVVQRMAAEMRRAQTLADKIDLDRDHKASEAEEAENGHNKR